MADYEWYSSSSKDEMYDLEKVSEMTNIDSPDYGALVVCAFPESESEEVAALKEEVKNWIQNNLKTFSIESDGRSISFDGEHYAREEFIENLSQFEKYAVPFSVYAAAFDDDFNEASLWARKDENKSFERVEYIDYDKEDEDFDDGLREDEFGNLIDVEYDSVVVCHLYDKKTRKPMYIYYIDNHTDFTKDKVYIQGSSVMYTSRSDGLECGSNHILDANGNMTFRADEIAGFDVKWVHPWDPKTQTYSLEEVVIKDIIVDPEDVDTIDGKNILQPEKYEKYKAIIEKVNKKLGIK